MRAKVSGVLFARLIGRPLLRHPLLALLNLLSIALGVAVVGAIGLANRSANEAFRNSVRLVAGEADLEVRGRIPEAVWPLLRDHPSVVEATPAVEWLATAPGVPGGYLRILGLDPFSTGTLRPFRLTAVDGGSPDLEAWLRNPSSLAVFPEFFSLHEAPRIGVETPRGRREFEVAFLLRPEDVSERGEARWAAMDLAWAQEAGDLVGYLTSVQLRLREGADAEAVALELRTLVPGDVTVQAPLGRTRQTEGMMESFQLNLTALSLVSLLVGCYLIYNSVAASVLRRRTEIGILRAMGASPHLLQGIFLLEAGAAGILGGLLGALLALPLAASLTGLVAATISSLYVLVSIERLAFTPVWVVAGAALGFAAAVVAAWWPSREALRVDPREVLHPGHLEEKQAPQSGHLLLGGIVLGLLAAGTGWLALATRFGGLGFVSAFLVLAAASLAAPATLLALGRCCQLSNLQLTARGGRGTSIWVPLVLGGQNLGRSLHRNSMTVAALAAALAMMVSISVMIASFRGSVQAWMQRTLVADIFVAPAANEIAGTGLFLPPDLLSKIVGHSGVAEIATFREVPMLIADQATTLGIYTGKARGDLDFLPVEGSRLPPGKTASELLETSGWVAVSESLGRRLQKLPGAEITLPLPDGPTTFRIAGWYRDYTRDSGTVLLPLTEYLRHGGEDRPQSAAIFLRNASAYETAVLNILEEASAERMPLSLYRNRELKERVGEIFDQTFAVTGVLRWIAIFVAVCGVFFGLGILVQERSREIGVLRSIGASRLQVLGMVLGEAVGLALAASWLGLVSGAGLAVVLTYVINLAFFGWTVELGFPWGVLAWTPLWVSAVALLAALIPAWQAACTPPATALRYE